ncbi:MAG: ChbG/HpnK family deacetylase, partial [Anaerolineae bacterium]
MDHDGGAAARQLIVNADDYGRTPGVSRGILEAHRAGIVTSTSVMINQPGIEAQLAEALAQPGLGVGQHLVFTAGRPVLPAARVPGLVDAGGRFLDQHEVWARAERIPPAQMRTELMAQVERFRALAGHLPDHLDCHHFVHLYPPFFQVYADLAAGYRLPLRLPFSAQPDFRLAPGELPYLEEFPPDLVRGMIATDSNLARSRDRAYPDHFVATFYGRQALSRGNLLGLLEELPPGVSELMCHPGYDDEDLAASSYRAEREIELALLTDPAVRQAVLEMGIELVTFGRLHTE